MFKGLGGLANLGNIVKQAQEMNTKMQALGEQLKTKRATGTAGGGLVEVEVDGTGQVLAVRLDPDLVAKGDREMLEDLLPSAFNAAKEKAQALHQEAMQEMTGDLNLPGMGDLLNNLGGNPADQA
ncbi:YbaB/EbfC family nucleoid-associated protein [Aeoliella mucimassa]|uniref:Nucleoid-associated protein Pan181_43490 n=1 Tax=Aeoliella mucimassa TaxID=2527972 RepID=A0A518ATS0_9BACT|nr:YbaB/EbfC family nucleoid-associated protein [Aeoliella mucimassa]QDU58122.1 Nucleoid-associated protein YbaB [Aeoliella mucimassa]